MTQENGQKDDARPESQEETSTPAEDPGDDIPSPPIAPLVDHPPIIVTGGSTAIEFQRAEYQNLAPGTHNSSGLFLHSVEISRQDGATHVCHTLTGNEVCLVVIECKRTGLGNKDVTVLGGRSVSPAINFDHGEYGEISSAPERRRHFNANRKIERLLIFRVIGGVPESPAFHECPLVPENGRCDITINDRHIHLHQ